MICYLVINITGRGSKKVMCRDTLKSRLNKTCEELMNSLKEEMVKIDFVCTTADLWSGAKRGMCAY